MAQISCLSPSQLSPIRKPLQNLSTNANFTPQKIASGKLVNGSPVIPGTPLTPALLLGSKKRDHGSVEHQTLNPSRKRAIDEVIAEERDPARASFSSLINYDPPSSDGPEQAQTSIPACDESAAKSRAETLRLRLQMAMFRVRTNQMETPFAQLVVPRSPMAASHSHSTSNDIPNTAPLPITPPLRIRSGSGSSTEEDLPRVTTAERIRSVNQSLSNHLSDDVTSIVAKGDAISGLLELRRGN